MRSFGWFQATRARIAAAMVGAAATLCTRDARANSAPVHMLGERHGSLVPQASTHVRVDSEQLVFHFDHDSIRARVTATYRMTAESEESLDIAFVFVRLHGTGVHFGLNGDTSVELDGTKLDYTVKRDGQILEPRLEEWLAAHPSVAAGLRAAVAESERDTSTVDSVEEVARGAGEPCTSNGCPGLFRWFTLRGHTNVSQLRDEAALEAAREAIPEDLEALQRGWSTLGEGRGLGFLVFHVDWAAGQTHELTIVYDHIPSIDRREHVSGLALFEYLLTPASRWASFGPLDVTVELGIDADFISDFPFERDGNVLHAAFHTLPERELTFTLVRRKDLWPGLTRYRDYWIALGASIAVASMAAGGAAGTKLGRRRGWGGALAAIFLAGIVAVAVFFVVSAKLPNSALGFDDPFDGPPRGRVMMVVGCAAGALAALLAFVRARRQPARVNH